MKTYKNKRLVQARNLYWNKAKCIFKTNIHFILKSTVVLNSVMYYYN